MILDTYVILPCTTQSSWLTLDPRAVLPSITALLQLYYNHFHALTVS